MQFCSLVFEQVAPEGAGEDWVLVRNNASGKSVETTNFCGEPVCETLTYVMGE